MKKVKDWMEWKGITLKDLMLSISTLGFLIFVSIVITYSFIVSLLN